jgi:hypothetical protein
MTVRVPLYDRLPEVYRIEDAKHDSGEPLRAMLALLEQTFSAVHENIEALYHDLFLDTCDPWAIPYIADLLGTSHLTGDPATIRRDVAGTIGWRRRKGTLGVIEAVTEALTGWGVHAAELFKDLAWTQDLDHQRPDAGGAPPYAATTVDRHTVVRGGTATLRDPSTLALLDTPFDSFARVPDFRAPVAGALRPNLPNLAVFLWRLQTYRLGPVAPVHRGTEDITLASGVAGRAVRFDLHPLGEPVRLFNPRVDEDGATPLGSGLDRKPGPLHPARLDSMRPPLHRGPTPPTGAVGDLWFDTDTEMWSQWNGTEWVALEELIVDELIGGAAGRPEAYVLVAAYDPAAGEPHRVSELALELHVPEGPFSPFDAADWTQRGANLCAWEKGLRTPLAEREIAIDPVVGRIVVAVRSKEQSDAVRDRLRAVFAYGTVGPVGAHPIDRPALPAATATVGPGTSLEDAIGDLQSVGRDVVVRIDDDHVHELDLANVAGTVGELGGSTLRLARSLTIRAADGARPILRLARPIRARALDAERADGLTVTLEGVRISRGPGMAAGDALIARADLGSIVLEGCTLDPGGEGLRLRDTDSQMMAADPEVHVRRAVTGPLRIDRGYRLYVTDSIIDGGSGVNEDPATAGYALSGATGPPAAVWGPQLQLSGVTFFGRVRVERASGSGGIFAQPFEVLDNQTGCLKYSWLSGRGDRLPQAHACVRGTGDDPAPLHLVSEIFGRPEYGQIAADSNFRVRERGPGDDEMGAFGFLLTAHKAHNLEIRYREFLPLGIRPLLVPVT